ncbi:MAG: hypothetical protein VZR11_12915 [Succinimonas sp.]|nr:hypothetical protein [Succinimonas sp.]
MEDIQRDAVISYIAGHPGKIPPSFLKSLFDLTEEEAEAASATEMSAETAAEKPAKTPDASSKIHDEAAKADESPAPDKSPASSQEPSESPEIAAICDKLKSGREISAREYLLLNNKDVAGLLTELEELAGDNAGRMTEELSQAIVTKELMKDPIIEEDFDNTGYY